MAPTPKWLNDQLIGVRLLAHELADEVEGVTRHAAELEDEALAASMQRMGDLVGHLMGAGKVE